MNQAILEKIKQFFPGLKTHLQTARISKTPDEFIKKTLITSGNMFAMLMFILIFLGTKIKILLWVSILFSPAIFAGLFYYFMQYPSMIIMKFERDINREIVYAGRFLVIELESGVPLYSALMNIIPAYPKIGPYFRDIITKVDLGTSMEDAINEAIMHSPSTNLRRIFWQILNSIKTGSDVHKSLNSVVDQIVKDQIIELKKYAKKLNPLAMFYMMVAIIVPTLGSAMLAVVANFIAIEITLPLLLILSLFLAFIQFMFLNIIKTQRPAVDI